MYLVTDVTTYFKLDTERFMAVAKRERFVIKGEYIYANVADINRACTAEVWKAFWKNPIAAHYLGDGIDLQLNLKMDYIRNVRTIKYILFINGEPVHEWSLDDFLRDKILVLPGDKYPPALVKYFGNIPRDTKQLFVLLTPNDVVFAETFGNGMARE